MDTPYDSDDRSQCPTDRLETVGVTEHLLCGLAGFLFTVALLVAFYPLLVALVQPMHVLSSTMLVVLVVALWLLVSFGVEIAWEWRAGRLTADR